MHPALFPRRHGAWAVLLGAFLAGTLAAGAASAWSLVLFPAVLSGFLARHAAGVDARDPGGSGRRAARRAAQGFTAACLGIGALPVALGGLWGLAPIGLLALAATAISLVLERRGGALSAESETAGVLGLCLVAPAAEYAAAGAMTARTAAVGFLCAAFFLGGVLRVRHLLRRRAEGAGPSGVRFRAGASMLAYHGLTLAAAAAAPLLGGPAAPPLVAATLLPGALQALWSVARRRTVPTRPQRVGRIELAHAVLFVGLVAAAYRTAG